MKTYLENKLLAEIKELMENDELYYLFETTYRRYEPWLNVTNKIVKEVYKFNDHGPIHALLTAKRSLEILRILKENGYILTAEQLGKDVEMSKFIVSFASLLHDIGNSIHRDKHYLFSVILVKDAVFELCQEIYPHDPYLPTSLTLGAIYGHDEAVPSITWESSIVTMADGLDMEVGRSRLKYSEDQIDIHSVSAYSIRDVRVMNNKNKRIPIKVVIDMENLAGIFQVDEILTKKVSASLLRGRVFLEIKTPEKTLTKVV